MIPARELIINHEGRLLYASSPRYDSFAQYEAQMHRVAIVVGAVEYEDVANPDQLIVVVGIKDTSAEDTTDYDAIVEGVGHAWGNRLSHLGNTQILEAITRGVQAAMQEKRP